MNKSNDKGIEERNIEDYYILISIRQIIRWDHFPRLEDVLDICPNKTTLLRLFEEDLITTEYEDENETVVAYLDEKSTTNDATDTFIRLTPKGNSKCDKITKYPKEKYQKIILSGERICKNENKK